MVSLGISCRAALCAEITFVFDSIILAAAFKDLTRACRTCIGRGSGHKVCSCVSCSVQQRFACCTVTYCEGKRGTPVQRRNHRAHRHSHHHRHTATTHKSR
jgi:hypothetical protein